MYRGRIAIYLIVYFIWGYIVWNMPFYSLIFFPISLCHRSGEKMDKFLPYAVKSVTAFVPLKCVYIDFLVCMVLFSDDFMWIEILCIASVLFGFFFFFCFFNIRFLSRCVCAWVFVCEQACVYLSDIRGPSAIIVCIGFLCLYLFILSFGAILTIMESPMFYLSRKQEQYAVDL